MFYVYVIKSDTSGKIYIGHTQELQARLREHRNGYSTATKQASDWNLIHFEQYPDRALAMKREAYLKSGDGRRVLKLKRLI